MNDDEDTLPEAQYEGEWYRWACADCGSVFESDIDMRGDVVECVDCGLRQRVQA